MNVRPIQCNDYYKSYLSLLEQLTIVEKEKISYNDFENFVNNLSHQHRIIVIEYNNKIIASGTLLIENKFIHKMGKIGHIEDIVTDKDYRNKGLGRKIIENLLNISHQVNCYKVILNCNEENVGFYEKNGFLKKEIEMVKYL